jgi:predicted CXXCH cytochrome family protein
VLVLLGGWVLWQTLVRDRFPLSPVTASPYRNTGAEAHYVGSPTCVACHAEEHASFRRTGMGRSTAAVDPSREPADAVFEHRLSKRRYQVVRKEGELWHRELLRTDGPDEVLLAEYPVKFVVGSGHQGRTYLIEADGFFLESPVTWFASRNAWDVSPGYDHANQPGFSRAIGEECLFCHAGRVEIVGRSTHRLQIHEAAIGCERCHGPGSLHVARHSTEGAAQATASNAARFDDTIVNPAHLSRELAEAVCQQCHLEAGGVDATVSRRGRRLSDFRPGLRFEDFRAVYVSENAGTKMTVVGHVAQMHLSRCYQASPTFTCLTCHDPHGEPEAAERVAYFRAVCLECHRAENCTVSAERRIKESPDNNCIHCHMPRSATEVAHVASTHHRVGIHTTPSAAQEPPLEPPELRSFFGTTAQGGIDDQLALGEAYRLLSLRNKNPLWQHEYAGRALTLLRSVYTAGLRDGDLDASLAQLYFNAQSPDAVTFAESALRHPNLAGQSRCDALYVVSQDRASRGDYRGAIAALKEITELRRYGKDWLLIGDYAKALGDMPAAIDAYQSVVRINPRQWQVQQFLAAYFRQQGDLERAAYHEKRAVP